MLFDIKHSYKRLKGFSSNKQGFRTFGFSLRDMILVFQIQDTSFGFAGNENKIVSILYYCESCPQ